MRRFLLQRPAASFAWRLVLFALCGTSAHAQGATSAAIAGRVLDESGNGVAGVEVIVTNEATGISVRARTQSGGRYRLNGLEVGGPYAVTARRIGFPVQSRAGVFLSLGQQSHVDLALQEQAVRLPVVETRAARGRLLSRARTGTESLVSDSMIRRMPVLNRDLYDLVRLVPQTSTSFALTASGAGPRANSIRIDGVSDQVPSSNLAAGALYGGKVIPLDAVKEFQVLLSPFDVRYGSFAGAAVNAVTRSGTNELHGSAFAYGTNEQLGADVPLVRAAPYQKTQVGLSLGGPVVPDRLHFFVASELQRRAIPALGPYVGQSGSFQSVLPVAGVDVARFQRLLIERGLDGGSSGAVMNENPSSSTFLRLDAAIAPWHSRATVRGSYSHADSAIFDRPTMLAPTNCPATTCFPLSSLQHSRWVDKRTAAVQLLTNFPGGAYNELQVGYLHLVSGFRPTVAQPLILVTVPGTNGSPAVLQSGTHEIATGQRNASNSAELTDNLSIVAGAHRVTMGLSTQRFDLWAFQLRGGYGVWEFASLDSLQSGAAARYRVTRDTGSVTAASGGYHALYVGDEWEASPRLSLIFGVRADLSVLSARPPYVASVDSSFHLRTDNVPSGRVAWSPRIGFNYRLSDDGDAPAQVRGGVGLFTGRPPLFWLLGGFAAAGLAARTLQCGNLAGDAGAAPSFRADFRDPPLACAGGQTFAAQTRGEIDVIDPGLRLPQTMRATLAVDARLPFGTIGTLEALYTHATRALFFTPINLAEPIDTDPHGRVMYGPIAATGAAAPRRVSSAMGDVIAVSTQSRDYAYDLTAELRTEGRVGDVGAAFSYGRARDVQSPRPVSSLLADTWRYARPVTGRQDDLELTISDFDQPFRVRAFGTLHSPWRTLPTELSLLYIGGAGLPYTYVAGGAQGRGDLNADGAVGNDAIYVPQSALDPAEIAFAGSPEEVRAQQDALERFIQGAQCLRDQRGAIMARNSCRSPWMHRTSLAIRQTVPGVRAHALVVEAQVFNLLNLLDPRWGSVQLPPGVGLANTSQIPLLTQVGETATAPRQPIYRYEPTTIRYTGENLDSYYQVQFSVRYTF